MDRVKNGLAKQRESLGIKQLDVARRAGITRQSLSSLEAGKSVPSTAVALRLAQVLSCRVEDLFWIDDAPETVISEWVDARPKDGHPARGLGSVAKGRATLASIDGRWVAHPLEAADPRSTLAAADALVSAKSPSGPIGPGRVQLRLLKRPDELWDTLLCAGCAPALGVLAARLNERSHPQRTVWLDRPSVTSLQMLRDGQVHIAGAHLFDEDSHEYNVPEVSRMLAGRPMEVINLVRWEAGIVVAPGNPRRIRGVGDMVRPGVTVVRRRSSAAAGQLLSRLLRKAGANPESLQARGPVAEGHGDVARLVSLGIADAGIAILSAATALGLGFIPLAEERFDLVIPVEHLGEPRVIRLLETLGSRGYRRDVEGLGGIIARSSGSRIARTA